MDNRTVTVDQAYLDALLRRAGLGESESAQDDSFTLVSKAVHENLLRESRDYHTLRQTLLDSGVMPKSLDNLVRGSKLALGELGSTYDQSIENNGSLDHATGTSLTLPSGIRRQSVRPDSQKERDNWRKSPPGAFEVDDGHFSYDNFHDNAAARPRNVLGQQKSPQLGHTLLLSNLPESVTHRDVTSVIKGGRLVDIWIRRSERSAAVTFAEGAATFLAHAKHNDVYLMSKRIDVSWSDRQFVIAPHMSAKLAKGHSRNLVIRGALGRLTDERIREDMEHIHNLVIIATVWKGPDVYINTNSVNNATFARNCLMSRLQYKGLKIDWYPDECAEELPPKTAVKSAPLERRRSSAALKPTMPVTNRFDLLSLEEGLNSDDGGVLFAEEDLDGSDFQVSSAGTAAKHMVAA